MIRRLHPHYTHIYLLIYLFYIKKYFIYIYIYINNLKLYEVSGQFSVSAFQFHVKKTSFWLNTKLKVQNRSEEHTSELQSRP